MHTTRLPLYLTIAAAIISCKPNPLIIYPGGGYNYPATVKDSSFYYYPLMDSFTKRDSFRASTMEVSYKAFNEPNLSLKPAGEDVFRLYLDGFKQLPVIITLTRHQIVVKQGLERFYQIEDTNRLTPTERFHFQLLSFRYPLQEWRKNSKRQKYYDSLITLYPQLTQTSYLKYLHAKSFVPRSAPYKYATIKKSISYNTFYAVVSQLNAIGYWKMPYKLPCLADVSDGDSYLLEANTPKKYNYVRASSCNDQEDFSKVCQQIIKLAGLDDKIQLYDDPTIAKKPQEPVKVIEQDVIIEDAPKPLNIKCK